METTDKMVIGKALKGMKLLLAEDYLDNQVLISRGLKYLGAEVDVAGDGQEAVDKARENDYDVVLMDLQMPVLDGIEAMKLLRAEFYTKPIIALTARAHEEEKEQFLKAGFDGYVTKPMNRESLIRTLQEAAHGRPARRQ